MTIVVDLSDLGNRGFAFRGGNAGDAAGYSVAAAGDVNSDGYADMIIGAPGVDDFRRHHIGVAYVIFGKADGFDTVDLATLTPDRGFSLEGEPEDFQQDEPGSFAGSSVAYAGDINGDGIDDMIVGSPKYNDFDGRAYVVYGRDDGEFPSRLGYMSSDQGFVIQSDWEAAGFSVSTAGDVNGDGLDDLIVGEPFAEGPGHQTYGQAYVIFGTAGGYQEVRLGNLPSSAGFVIRGESEYDQAGNSVASAGDVNGDGIADIMVGAIYNDDGGESAGRAYVVFGKAGGFGDDGVVGLATLTGADGFTLRSDEAGDLVGCSVASAGTSMGTDSRTSSSARPATTPGARGQVRPMSSSASRALARKST